MSGIILLPKALECAGLTALLDFAERKEALVGDERLYFYDNGDPPHHSVVF